MSRPAVKLNDEAIACLRRLDRDGGEVAPRCRAAVLRQLCSQGLVERVTLNWLPLEMQQFYYRITQDGAALLERIDTP